jgi:hypothetical protein
MASAASAGLASKEKSSEPSETLSKLEEQIETIRKRIEYNQLKFEKEETTMKDILKECAGDENKKKERLPDLKKHFEEKKQLLSKIETDRGQQSNLKDMHFNLLRQLWNETKSPELAEKLKNVLLERRAAKDKSASAGPPEGGKRRKTTTRKQKGRCATKKQNKNKKSRKQ